MDGRLRKARAGLVRRASSETAVLWRDGLSRSRSSRERSGENSRRTVPPGGYTTHARRAYNGSQPRTAALLPSDGGTVNTTGEPSSEPLQPLDPDAREDDDRRRRLRREPDAVALIVAEPDDLHGGLCCLRLKDGASGIGYVPMLASAAIIGHGCKPTPTERIKRRICDIAPMDIMIWVRQFF